MSATTSAFEAPAPQRSHRAVSFASYRRLLFADLFRYAGRADWLSVLRHYWRGESFRYVFWFRTCAYARSNPLLKYLLYFPLARFQLRRYRYKLGISIRPNSLIAEGLYIGHFGGIFISDLSPIGRNCNISQDVTIGHAIRGDRKGVPSIGESVYIGPGAKVFGNIRIGNNVAIGANAVVTRDVPDNAVVGGIPAKIISYDGSREYIQNTGYEREWWHCCEETRR